MNKVNIIPANLHRIIIVIVSLLLYHADVNIKLKESRVQKVGLKFLHVEKKSVSLLLFVKVT